MRRNVFRVMAGICALLAATGAQAQMKTYEILDRQGFERELVAHTVSVPADWEITGQILWTKPCSANELYEVVLTARAPDGRTGFRIMPGHQVIWTDYMLRGDPYYEQLGQAQSEAQRNKLRTQFQGSNCHVALITDPAQLFQTLVLANRPSDVRIVSQTPNEATKASFKQTFGPSQPGFEVLYDALNVEMAYTLNGGPVFERMAFSWYMFNTEINDANMWSLNRHSVVNALQFDWVAAERRAADEALLKQIAASFKTNPDWQKRVIEVQRRIAEERRRQYAEDAERRKWDRFFDNIIDDIQHYQFLEYIRQ